MIVKLGDIARECKCTSDNKDCPIVGLEHLEPKELLLKNYSSDPNTTFTKSFKAGQILFGRRRSYQQKASVATFDGICSGDIIVIEAIPEKVEPRLLPFIIQNEAFFNYSIIGSAGGLSPRVKWQHLANYEFELPSLDEQRVLADKLWAAYEVKESYKNLLAQTDKLLHAQFEKMFGEETNIKSWKDVLTIRNGKAYPKEYLEEGPYPIYGSGGVMGYAEDYLFDEDTIIVGRKGNINNPIFVREKYWTVDTAFCLDIDKKILNPIYFYNWCQQFDFTYFNKQGVLPSLTRTDLYTIKMPVPPMEKQLEFVRIAEQAEQTKASLNKGIEAIEAVIRSLIAEGTTKV